MGQNNFADTVTSLFKGMDSFISTKTGVGDAVRFDDGTIILPLVDVSFGVGAGALSKVIDMVPGVIDKFKKSPKDKAEEKEMVAKGEEFLKEQEK